MKMKELESRTGFGREAIRFYLREGMLPEPHRPKRNVAHYDEDHVRRLLAIKKLKEERFLPLSVIKSLLETNAYQSLLASQPLAGLEHLLPAIVNGVTAGGDRRVKDVEASSGVSTEEIHALQERGVLQVRGAGGAAWLDFRDAAIVENWGKFRRAGFSTERGYSVERLVEYAEFAQWLAAGEVKQFIAAFGADTDAQSAAEIGARGIELVNELLTLLHTRALIREVTEGTKRW
ncbi:MAG: MerR family transcriptional regulator [Gammaproteobacteria bacterium]|nr:MerR family transcriptional regulator [Gammaproteobacteria bacterium]